jgi:hypothetical protein
MPLRDVGALPPLLFRIGRAPNPLAAPPRAFAGGGRYDDPRQEFVVLYAAQERRGAFVETLDAFRPAITDLAALDQSPRYERNPPLTGSIPRSYFDRLIGIFRLTPGQRWLDLRSPETHQTLRFEIASILVDLGYHDRFVLGDLLASDHRLTRAIARLVFERGCSGVAYPSCHDPGLTCWAIFEQAIIEPASPFQTIRRDDPDLVAVASLFQLVIPEQPKA